MCIRNFSRMKPRETHIRFKHKCYVRGTERVYWFYTIWKQFSYICYQGCTNCFSEGSSIYDFAQGGQDRGLWLQNFKRNRPKRQWRFHMKLVRYIHGWYLALLLIWSELKFLKQLFITIEISFSKTSVVFELNCMNWRIFLIRHSSVKLTLFFNILHSDSAPFKRISIEFSWTKSFKQTILQCLYRLVHNSTNPFQYILWHV